jgi:hypothetical protein
MITQKPQPIKGNLVSPDNLSPKFCCIDGSLLEVIDDTLVCEAESHNWELELGEHYSTREFYTLRLTGY